MANCYGSYLEARREAEDDEVEARQSFIERFIDDACDDILDTDGEAHFLIGNDVSISELFEKLMCADKENAFSRLLAMREAMRAKVLKDYAEGVRVRAERLADEHIKLMSEP